jgi:hypothetical protein
MSRFPTKKLQAEHTLSSAIYACKLSSQVKYAWSFRPLPPIRFQGAVFTHTNNLILYAFIISPTRAIFLTNFISLLICLPCKCLLKSTNYEISPTNPAIPVLNITLRSSRDENLDRQTNAACPLLRSFFFASLSQSCLHFFRITIICRGFKCFLINLTEWKCQASNSTEITFTNLANSIVLFPSNAIQILNLMAFIKGFRDSLYNWILVDRWH